MAMVPCLFMTLVIFSGPWAMAQSKKSVDYVDPFIGTDFFGHTYPGAALPNAMVHLGPDVHTEGWTYCAGYVYSESSLMGFSHTHWSGVGMVNGGEVLLMPTTSQKLQVVPGTLEDPDSGYRSRFDHSEESASPGYYSVRLKDYGIKVELTGHPKGGFSSLHLSRVGDFPDNSGCRAPNRRYEPGPTFRTPNCRQPPY